MTLWGNNFKNLVSKTLSHGKALVFTLRKMHKVYVYRNIVKDFGYALRNKHFQICTQHLSLLKQ